MENEEKLFAQVKLELEKQKTWSFNENQRELRKYVEKRESLKKDWKRLQEEELVEEEKRLLQGDYGISVLKVPPSKWTQVLNMQLELLKQQQQSEEFHHRLRNPTADKEFHPHPVNWCQMLRQMQPRKPLKQLLPPPAVAWNEAVRRKRSQTNPLNKTIIHLLHQNCEATFKVTTDYRTLHCHPLLLSILCGHFEHRSGQLEELYLPPCLVSTEAFVRAYRWLLEPLTVLKLSQLLELTRTACFMDIKDLREQCWFELFNLLKRRSLIYSIYTMAKHECINLEKIMVPYLANIFLPFVASSNFLKLKYDLVLKLFKVAQIAVNSEMEIFYALLMWLDHDWKRRKCQALKLFQFINLDMMPLSFLLSFSRRTDCPPAFDFIRSDAVDEEIYNIISALKNEPYKYKGNIVNKRRQWIYDSGCKYHHCTACNKLRFVTYSDFIDYLDFLQSTGCSSHSRIKPADDPSIVCCKRSQ